MIIYFLTFVWLNLTRLIMAIYKWKNYVPLVFFLRQIAIKEIILDPNKKNRTKEAVLKEARYIHLCKLFYQLIITIIINLLLLLLLWLSLLSSASSLIISKRCSTITLSLSTELWGRPDILCKGKGRGKPCSGLAFCPGKVVMLQ